MIEFNGHRLVSLKISLIHATRGRPAKTLSMRDEWFSTASIPQLVEHIWGVDYDDTETVDATKDHTRVIVNPPKGCFRAYNLAAEASSGDIIIPIEDDLWPPQDWDRHVRSAMEAHLDFPAVLAVGDGQNLVIEWCINRKFYESRGLFHDDYWGLFGDTEWRTRARADKIPMVLAPGIVFRHVQYQPDSGMSDPIFERKQARYLEDERTYNLRGRLGWPA